MAKYKGIVVEESLEDNRALNGLEVIGLRITGQQNPLERWHLYTVMVTDAEIEKLAAGIKPAWYMHFWQDRNVLAVFKDQRFSFNYDDKNTWRPVVEYGQAVGIPESQLDFPID